MSPQIGVFSNLARSRFHSQVKKVRIICLKSLFEVPLDLEFRFLVPSLFPMLKKEKKTNSKMTFKAIPYYCTYMSTFFFKFFAHFLISKFGAPTHFQRLSTPGHPAQYAHGVNLALRTFKRACTYCGLSAATILPCLAKTPHSSQK